LFLHFVKGSYTPSFAHSAEQKREGSLLCTEVEVEVPFGDLPLIPVLGASWVFVPWPALPFDPAPPLAATSIFSARGIERSSKIMIEKEASERCSSF